MRYISGKKRLKRAPEEIREPNEDASDVGELEESEADTSDPLDETACVVQQLRADGVTIAAQYRSSDERGEVDDAEHKAILH